MNKYIQTFIKNNKEFIDKNQWYLLFDSWMSFADYIYPLEEAYLQELLDMFKTAGITVNMHERKQVIVDSMCDIVNIVLNDRAHWGGEDVSFSYIYKELPSKLLFSKEEVYSFIPEAVNALNKTITGDAIIL